MPVITKRCWRCAETKPLAAFSRRRRNQDGVNEQCRACAGAASKARRHQKAAAGLCVSCGGDRGERRGVLCAECTDKRAVKAAERYQRVAAAGVCTACRRAPANSPGPLCRPCWFKGVSVRHFGTVTLAGELERMFHAQGGRCFYTSVPLRIEPGARTWDSASLEHVIPVSRGGAKDLANVVWVTDQVNRAKGEHDMRDLLAMSRALLSTAAERGVGAPRFLDMVLGHAPWLGSEAANDNAAIGRVA